MAYEKSGKDSRTSRRSPDSLCDTTRDSKLAPATATGGCHRPNGDLTVAALAEVCGMTVEHLHRFALRHDVVLHNLHDDERVFGAATRTILSKLRHARMADWRETNIEMIMEVLNGSREYLHDFVVENREDPARMTIRVSGGLAPVLIHSKARLNAFLDLASKARALLRATETGVRPGTPYIIRGDGAPQWARLFGEMITDVARIRVVSPADLQAQAMQCSTPLSPLTDSREAVGSPHSIDVELLHLDTIRIERNRESATRTAAERWFRYSPAVKVLWTESATAEPLWFLDPTIANAIVQSIPSYGSENAGDDEIVALIAHLAGRDFHDGKFPGVILSSRSAIAAIRREIASKGVQRLAKIAGDIATKQCAMNIKSVDLEELCAVLTGAPPPYLRPTQPVRAALPDEILERLATCCRFVLYSVRRFASEETRTNVTFGVVLALVENLLRGELGQHPVLQPLIACSHDQLELAVASAMNGDSGSKFDRVSETVRKMAEDLWVAPRNAVTLVCARWLELLRAFGLGIET